MAAKASVLLVATLVVLSFFSAAHASSCAGDITTAGKDMGVVVADIGSDVAECVWGSKASCSQGVDTTLADLSKVIKDIAATEDSCNWGGAACKQRLSGIANDLNSLGDAIKGIMNTCDGSGDTTCFGAITAVSMAAGKIVADIATTATMCAIGDASMLPGTRGGIENLCNNDIHYAGVDASKAIEYILTAVSDCSAAKPQECLEDVENAALAIEAASRLVTQAVAACGISHNVACALYIEGILEQFDVIALDLTKAAPICLRNEDAADNAACAAYLGAVKTAMGTIVKDIASAIPACSLAKSISGPVLAAVTGMCQNDLNAAGDTISDAVSDAFAAVHSCGSLNPDDCAADVERVLRDLTDTAEEITQAVKDCGLSRNVACARNVETILSQIENATIDVTEAVSKCAQASSSGKDRTECAGAVAGAAAAFGNIASDIGNAVMACM